MRSIVRPLNLTARFRPLEVRKHIRAPCFTPSFSCAASASTTTDISNLASVFDNYLAKFEVAEHESFTGRLEIEEFLNLLEVKCDCELAYARILRKIANYRFVNLAETPFE